MCLRSRAVGDDAERLFEVGHVIAPVEPDASWSTL
jgi:hypothetical protein